MAVLQQASQQMRDAARIARDAEATRQTQARRCGQPDAPGGERAHGRSDRGGRHADSGWFRAAGGGPGSGFAGHGWRCCASQGRRILRAGLDKPQGGGRLARCPELQATVQARATQLEAQAASFGADAARSSAKSQRVSSVAQAGAAAAGGIGGLTSAAQERRAAEHEARRAELDVEAKVHETASRRADEAMQQMLDIIRGIREKLAGMEQSRSETARSVARNI